MACVYHIRLIKKKTSMEVYILGNEKNMFAENMFDSVKNYTANRSIKIDF